MATSHKNANYALAYREALRWHIDCSAGFAWAENAVNYAEDPLSNQNVLKPAKDGSSSPIPTNQAQTVGQGPDEDAAQSRQNADKLDIAADSLDSFKQAIASFDGLAIQKTATNIVFSDGNPEARIMLIGEAPGTDEDRQGKPFVGKSGELLDKILSFINIDRHAEDPAKTIYISNILNWRPPGNRTPTPSEIEISLPFIEKHIALIKPDILILCGGIAAKTLLNKSDGITKLRGKWSDFSPQILPAQDFPAIKAMATYHPSYLLRNPAQKKNIWQDMLAVRNEI